MQDSRLERRFSLFFLSLSFLWEGLLHDSLTNAGGGEAKMKDGIRWYSCSPGESVARRYGLYGGRAILWMGLGLGLGL